MFVRLLLALALATAAWAQQTPAFEVISVKQSEPITPALVNSGKVQIGVALDAHYFRATQYSMFDLLCLAFQVKAHQLSGPDWMITQRYDIQAKLPEGAARAQVPAMLQAALAERFGLKYRKEPREISVYAVTVGKDGPRLKLSPPPDPKAPAPPPGQLRGGVIVGPGGTQNHISPNGNTSVTPDARGNLHVTATQMTLAGFVSFIGRYFDQPVFDMTNLTEKYDMEFDVSADEVRAGARAHGVMVAAPVEPSDPSGVSLSSSLPKLGLKIDSRKAPVEVLVIEKLERVPTAN